MSGTLEDAYSILNLYPDCSLAEARDSYKQAALKHHPDRQPEHRKEEASRRFKIYANAYLQICHDLGHEVEEQELAAPKTITGLHDTPGALALRQAGRQASLKPPSPAGSARSHGSTNSAVSQRRRSPVQYQQQQQEEYPEPEEEYYPATATEDYDESVADGSPEAEYYDPRPPVARQQPQQYRRPPQVQQRPPPVQSRPQGNMNGYVTNPRRGFGGGGDAFMGGFDPMDRDLGFGGPISMPRHQHDAFPSSVFASMSPNDDAAVDPFDQMTKQMTTLFGGLDLSHPTFQRDGGSSTQMRTRRTTIQENPDGSWSGRMRSKEVRAADGKIDLQEGEKDFNLAGGRRGRGGGRGGGPQQPKSARYPQQQRGWDEPPPQYSDDRFQDLPPEDAYPAADDDEVGFYEYEQDPAYSYGYEGEVYPDQAGRRDVPRIVAPGGGGGTVARRGGPPPAQAPPRRPSIQGHPSSRAVAVRSPGAPAMRDQGQLVRGGGQAGGQAGRGRANPMTKYIVPRGQPSPGTGGGQLVRRNTAGGGQVVAGGARR